MAEQVQGFPAFTDTEAMTEVARLSNKIRLVTRHMGGPFPPGCDLSGVETVLDVACGPGSWTLEVARAYPRLHVIGIDSSQRMLGYAQRSARDAHLENVSFRLMDVTKPLLFADESVDYIHSRFLAEFMPAAYWETLIAEYRRILTPGGMLALTEFEMGRGSTPGHERAVISFCEAMARAGRSLSAEEHPTRLGIIEHLRPWLLNAGFLVRPLQTYMVDYSFGAPEHDTWVRDLAILMRHVSPFKLRIMPELTSQAEHELVTTAIHEMEDPDFHALFTYLTAWGIKYP